MKLLEVLAQKKTWRAHMRRVKSLPIPYQTVYHEIQRYIFKIGPVEFETGLDVLSGIVGLMEEGAAAGKDVLDVTGKDVAAFCDALMAEVPTQFTETQELLVRETEKALKKAVEKVAKGK